MIRKLAADISKLAPAERMAVLSDELALVRAGRHDVGALLDLAAAFGQERIPDVVQAVADVLSAVHGDYTTDATRGPYRAWLSRLLRPALDEIGVSANSSDNDERKALRATLVGVLGGTARDPGVIEKARELVRQELDKPGSVEPTLLDAAVALAAVGGDAALYDRYLTRSKAATDPEDRYRWLYSLASFPNPALVRRTMDLILSSDVRSQDSKYVIARMLASSDNQRLAWQLIRERWPEIQKKTGEFVGNTVIVGALSSFCDARAAAEVRAFFAKNPVPDAERTLLQSLERITSCAQVAETQQPKLAEWLKGR
jgi:aminopeptidase N